MNDNHPTLERIASALERLAEHVAPQPGDIVGTPYVAHKLNCSTAWISQLIHDGTIPPHCIVAGTGNGKPWKLYRRQIDEWINSR